MQDLPVLLSGAVVGVILFQTAVIAPVVFTVIPQPHSATFLRRIFPRFFLLIALLGLLGNGASVLLGESLQVALTGATVLLALIAYGLIPATNKSRDDGDDRRFKQLHTASVLLTLVVLGLNLSALVA